MAVAKKKRIEVCQRGAPDVFEQNPDGRAPAPGFEEPGKQGRGATALHVCRGMEHSPCRREAAGLGKDGEGRFGNGFRRLRLPVEVRRQVHMVAHGAGGAVLVPAAQAGGGNVPVAVGKAGLRFEEAQADLGNPALQQAGVVGGRAGRRPGGQGPAQGRGARRRGFQRSIPAFPRLRWPWRRR